MAATEGIRACEDRIREMRARRHITTPPIFWNVEKAIAVERRAI